MSSPSLHSDELQNEKSYATVHKEQLDDDVPLLTPAEEKRLTRKIDYKLVPFLSLLYLLSFLDRVNIGQARLDGLEKDLGLVGNQYSVTLVIFFVSYVALEVPSNILLKKIRPSRFIPTIMIAWGIVMTLMSLVTNYTGLLIARFFLGLTESALFPCCCFYLVSWYKRSESNLRIAIFFSSATLSGAFGGILAYALSRMHGIGGKPGWFWIFAIEGLMTFVVGCIAPWMIEDFPEDCKFLTPTEKAQVVRRLEHDVGKAGEFRKVHIFNAFKDWRTYIYMLIYIGVAEPLYSLALFTPTIISELGVFTRWQSQLLSTPPYFLAFLVTMVTAVYSDKLKSRGWFNVFFMSIVVVGYAILLGVNPVEKPGVAYFALFLCVAGVAPCIANTITWTGNNMAPVLKRGTGMGMMFTLGNSGGIISSLVYFTQDKPRYFRGHGIGLGFAAMAALLSLFLRFNLAAENRRRNEITGTTTEEMQGDKGAEIMSRIHEPELARRFGLEGMTDLQIEELGDKSLTFRYYV
ncbi:putative MFS nicotinic acid transporter Tna1 [Rhodotorula diobovata]|uniref:Putative MFS nicotinic acid transporter Tna1 n=1 Tax=Rhodotorula diobovata TaxID=5288 RepID=A0A5C5G074_9BASI|nr:putative MFS nicotinic acid transporter Tna1 [Rhodotorula diobovata]